MGASQNTSKTNIVSYGFPCICFPVADGSHAHMSMSPPEAVGLGSLNTYLCNVSCHYHIRRLASQLGSALIGKSAPA